MTYEQLENEINNCKKCENEGYIKSNPIFSGNKTSQVLFVGQAPGVKNEFEKYPFNGGGAGKRLFEWLESAGWSEEEFRTKHCIASVTRCFPGKSKNGSDRIPSKREQQLCCEWIEQEIDCLSLKLIIPMGRIAIEYFIGKFNKLSDVIGKEYLYKNIIVIPLPHSSGASSWYYNASNKILLKNALTKIKKVKDTHKL